LRRTEAGKRRRTGRGRGDGGGRLAAGLPANRTVAAGLGVGIGTRLQNFFIYIFFDFRKKCRNQKKFEKYTSLIFEKKNAGIKKFEKYTSAAGVVARR
jgi:hypothetical protein